VALLFKNQLFLEQIAKRFWAAQMPVLLTNREASTLKEVQLLVSNLKELQLNRCQVDSIWSRVVVPVNLEIQVAPTLSTTKIQVQLVLEALPSRTLNASYLHQALTDLNSVRTSLVCASQGPSTFGQRKTCTMRTKTVENALDQTPIEMGPVKVRCRLPEPMLMSLH
jgi:hypothetical protein